MSETMQQKQLFETTIIGGLLRSMTPDVCQYVTRLRCANTAIQIEILLWMKRRPPEA